MMNGFCIFMNLLIYVRYSSVLKEYGWFDERKWLDIRGNHDTFVHYNGTHPYKKHTVYGSSGKGKVYSTIYSTESGPIRFIGIDANGPLYRHFNGFLLKDMIDQIENMLKSSEYDFFNKFTLVSQQFSLVIILYLQWIYV